MKTAVEWLQAEFNKWAEGRVFIPQDILEQAKKMEKEQIMTANIEGTEHWYRERALFGLDARTYGKNRAEQYYNETYNQNI